MNFSRKNFSSRSRRSSPAEFPAGDAADEAAARWAALLDAGALDDATAADLARWRAEDPRHGALLEGYLALLGRIAARVSIAIAVGTLKPGMRAPVASAERRVIRMSPVYFLRLAATTAVAASLAMAALWWVRRPVEFATTTGGRQVALLEDGTRVDLNARTALAVRMHRDLREASLSDGEVFFAVAKDRQRPFVVDTPQGRVRVTGTAFNLRMLGSQLDVVVVEGSVEVGLRDTAVQNLRANDQLSINEKGVRRRRLTAEQVQDTVAWREGRVVLKDEPLSAAVARFSRYHNVEVEVADEVSHLELGGSFRLDQLDDFLRDIEVVLPVHVLRGDGRARIVAR